MLPDELTGPNYALKLTVGEGVSGAITRCGQHGRLARALGAMGRESRT